MANSKYITEGIRKRIEFLAPVFIYAGEDELTALAHNAYRAMIGKQEIKIYS
jgi:butyrate kinase